MPKVLLTDVDPGFLPARHRGFRGAYWGESGDVVTPDVISPVTTWKLPVRVTSETSVSLSPPPATVDGVTLADEDRIGLVGQTDATENGIYKRTSLTVWERDSDFINGAVTEAGVEFYTQEGTDNAGKTYLLETQGAIDVGTTPLTFVEGSADVVQVAHVPSTSAFLTTSATFVPVTGLSAVVPADGDYLVEVEGEGYNGGGGISGAELRVLGTDAPSPTYPAATRQVTFDPAGPTEIKTMGVVVRASGKTAGDTIDVYFRRGAATPGTAGFLRKSLTLWRIV